ncbi:MAG: YajG family lipoprotein [Oleibacter sp.]|nr:YajG family lipoprotein [Thalassolituus sp.]
MGKSRSSFFSLAITSLALTLGGCVLAPQTIKLNEQAELEQSSAPLQRDALIRVVDKRENLTSDVIGTRGGRDATRSPLMIQASLEDILTARLQSSMAQLGFGGGSSEEPVKMQLNIENFEYRCNDGTLVNNCSVKMRFEVKAYDGPRSFVKPFAINESRKVATAPVDSYNQEWINDMLDRVWVFIFTDEELRKFLKV